MEAGKEEKVSDMFRFGMQMQMPETSMKWNIMAVVRLKIMPTAITLL